MGRKKEQYKSRHEQGLCVLSTESPLEWQLALDALRIQWSEDRGVPVSRSDILREFIREGLTNNPIRPEALDRASRGEKPEVQRLIPKARRLAVVMKQAAPVAGGAENQDTSEKETSPWGFEPQLLA